MVATKKGELISKFGKEDTLKNLKVMILLIKIISLKSVSFFLSNVTIFMPKE